jgi:hypothetical protein
MITMKHHYLLPCVCLVAIALAACGGKKDEPETAPAAPAQTVVVDTNAIADAAEETAERVADAVEDAVERVQDALELDGPVPTGTSWQVGEYTLTFKGVDEVVDGTVHGKVQGKGGEIPAFLPNGMEFTYTLEPDGAIVITTPRGAFRGTYDGEDLILDGNAATPLDQ